MSHDIPADAPGDSPMEIQGERSQLALPPLERDHRQGSLDARVVLVEYGDYQCLQCGELYALIKTIRQQLNATFFWDNDQDTNLCFVFRHFPQPQIHPQALKAAAAAEAAAAQGQFWQMHERLLEHQQALGDGDLVEYADNLRLEVDWFLRDIARKVHLDRINQDIASGLNSGVTAAPALFINRVRYIGHWDREQLMAAIVSASR